MKKYRVNVNGSLYEVEIEEMDAPVSGSVAPAAAQAPAAPKAAAPAGGQQIKAPMPGTILDVLVILEAMKMENEILAPCDGTVTSVSVKKGDSVETQALICTIA